MSLILRLLCCFGIDREVTEVEDTLNDPPSSNNVVDDVDRNDGVELNVMFDDWECEELPLSTMPYILDFLDETVLKPHFEQKTVEIGCLTQSQEGYECPLKLTAELANSDLMLELAKDVLAGARENVQDIVICESENDAVEALENQWEKEVLQAIDATPQIENKNPGESQKCDDVEPAQDFATSNPRLEEFVKTNAAADVTDKEKQEMDSELLSVMRSDLPPICSNNDQNITSVNGSEQKITDEVSQLDEIEKMDADYMLKNLFKEETEFSGTECIDNDSEIYCLSRVQEDFEWSKTTLDQFSLTEGLLAEATSITGKSIEAEVDEFPALEKSDLMLEPMKEVLAATENVQDNETNEIENDIVESEKGFLQVIDSTPQIKSSNQSLEEFVKTNAAADVTDKEMQEVNNALLFATLSDLPLTCSDTEQNVTLVNGNEQEVTDEDPQLDEIKKTNVDAGDKTIHDGTTVENMHRQSQSHIGKEVPDTSNNMKWSIGCKKPTEETKEDRKFNPREPNILPIIPEPELEKVKLKHHEMVERKNSEEWMLDYALRLSATKLAPERKTKVALLVEAFETVLPEPKYKARTIRHTPTSASAAFSHTGTIQACS